MGVVLHAGCVVVGCHKRWICGQFVRSVDNLEQADKMVHSYAFDAAFVREHVQL